MVPASPDPLRILPERPSPDDPAARYDLSGIAGILPALIDALSDAVVVLDRERRVVAANRRYVQEFGVRGGTILGEACHDVLACPDARQGASGRCPTCRALEGAGPQKVLRSVPDAAGRQRRWEVSFSPLTDAEGLVTHVVEVWRDVSDRSALEAQLARSERLASLACSPRASAHEINNPLASMLTVLGGSAAPVAARPHGTRRQHRGRANWSACSSARSSAHAGPPTSLMLLAQPVSATPGWVDLGGAAADTLSLLRFAIRKQGLTEVLDVAPGTPRLWAHESAVRGVCMNLILNAVQASAPGGEVRVKVAPREPYLALTIEDRGPGLPAQQPERIWEPFFTTKPARQGHRPGAVRHARRGHAPRWLDPRREPRRRRCAIRSVVADSRHGRRAS